MLQVPGLDASWISLSALRGGAWNSRGATFARSISLEFIDGGGVVRLGDIFLSKDGGEDGLTEDVGGEGGRANDTRGEGGDLLARGGEDEGFVVGMPGSSRSTFESGPAGPATGLRPSRNAFAISAAFHLEYLIFSMDCKYKSGCEDAKGNELRTDSEMGVCGKILRTSRKLAAARNFFAVDLEITQAP